MHLGMAALALPAGIALALLFARGEAVFSGEARASWMALAVTGAAGLWAVFAAAVRERRAAPPAPPPALRAIDEGLATPLGIALLAFDRSGRLVHVNAAARALTGDAPGLGRSSLGSDLPLLLQGIARGPAAGRVHLATVRGTAVAHAAAVRLPGPVPLDLVALRPGLPAPALGRRIAPVRSAASPHPDARPSRAVGALATALREPLARARTAASMLRLVTLPGEPARERHLATLEAELGVLERQVRVLLETSSLPRQSARSLDLGALAAEILDGTAVPRGVRVRRALTPATVQAEEPHLRQAVRNVLVSAFGAMPQGGELSVTLRQRGGEVVLEVSDTGVRPGPSLEVPVAASLVAAQGGQLEIEAIAGRGSVCRLTLPSARIGG